MYERVEDEDGNVKKNAVDDMAGRDSGGEGQNPKYVALLAGFAMLYMQQTNRDSKIRLVLLDEAFPNGQRTKRSLPALCKRTGITVDCVRTGRAAAVLDPKCGQCVRI